MHTVYAYMHVCTYHVYINNSGESRIGYIFGKFPPPPFFSAGFHNLTETDLFRQLAHYYCYTHRRWRGDSNPSE